MTTTLPAPIEASLRKVKSPKVRDDIRAEIAIQLASVGVDEAQLPPLSEPLNQEGRTVGNWAMIRSGIVLRPDSALSFDIIDEMKKSGIVMFAMLMKLAQIMTVFRTWRGWKVTSPDEDLALVSAENLKRILPRMMMEAGYHSLADGAAFLELRWWNTTKYALGLGKSKGNKTLYTVAKLPNCVDPRTISEIRRNPDNYKYEGFVQRNDVRPEKPIYVPREQSLILTYDEQFRDLWGNSFFRQIYPFWFWFEVVLVAMVRWSERMGIQTVVAKAPLTATFPDPNNPGGKIRAMDHMANVAASLAYSTYAAIPSDIDRETGKELYSLGYLGADDRTGAFVAILQEMAQNILRAALSADRALTQSSGGVGSYNIGELHAAATSLHNQMILTSWMYQINEYFMPWYSVYNRGEGGPPIWLEVEAIDPQYRELLKNLISTLGNAPAGQESFWMFDIRTIAELAAIPILSEEETAELKKKSEADALAKQEKAMKMASKFETRQPSNESGNNANSQNPNTAAKEARKAPDEVKAEAAYAELIQALMSDEEFEIPLYVDLETVRQNITLASGFSEGKIKRAKDGKFTFKPKSQLADAGGGGGENVESAIQNGIPQAQKAGGFRMFAGNALRIGGIGAIGIGVLSILNSKRGGGGNTITINGKEYVRDENGNLVQPDVVIPDGQEQAHGGGILDALSGMVAERINQEPVREYPKFDSPEEAMVGITNELKAAGLDPNEGKVIPITVGIEGSDPLATAMLAAHPEAYAAYSPFTNHMVLSTEAAEGLKNGDPFAVHSIVHELLHARQEDTSAGVSALGALTGITMPVDYIEGQNELVTGIFESKYTNAPPAAIAYQDQTATWAGIAKAAQKNSGIDPVDFVTNTHNGGTNRYDQIVKLKQAFPSQMANFNPVTDNVPSMGTIKGWIAFEGINEAQALQEIFDQAASE